MNERDLIWDLVEIVKKCTGCSDSDAEKAAGEIYRLIKKFKR